jgi:hypothetical protein
MNKEHYYTTRTDRERLSSSQRQVMSLEQKVTELQQEIVRLTIKSDKDDEMIEQSYQTLDKQREQTPMYMIQTLKECHDVIDDSTESGEGLKKDLRRVIKFLQQ